MPENKFKKIFASRLTLFLLLLAVIWGGIVLTRTHYKKNQLRSEIDNLKSEIEKIDKNNKELADLINDFSNNDFLEKEAKEKLNLKKEGENVMMVPEAAISGVAATPAVAENAASSPTSAAQETKNNFIKWWHYFFGR